MSGSNGYHSNGHKKPEKSGAMGAVQPEGFGIRSALHTTRRMAEHGELSSDTIPTIVAEAMRIATGNGTDRDKIAAMKLLSSLAKISMEAEQALDHIGRLDTGQNTENIGVNYQEAARRWTE